MLPPRAYVPPPSVSPNAPARSSSTDLRPSVVVAVDARDVDRFPAAPYARLAARTTTEAVRLIEKCRPRVIAVDWDVCELDHVTICNAAKQRAPIGILAVMTEPRLGPAALKAGCHSVLLKPFAVNLAAARIGRLCREMPAAAAVSRLGATLPQWGTNRTWPDVQCPSCKEGNAVCFEYSSHRRSWYACLRCEHVWIGPRRE